MPKQAINVTAVDPIQFVQRLLELGKQGATLKEKTFPRLKGLPYAVQLEIEVEGSQEVAKAPGVNPLPVPLAEKVFTKEELEAMEWDDFKKALKAVGIGGRDRDLMTTKYLKQIEEKTQSKE